MVYFSLCRYEPVFQIIDGRWEAMLNQPLHLAGYYLNPKYQYDPKFKTNSDIKLALLECMKKLVPDTRMRDKMYTQIVRFNHAKGLFGEDAAVKSIDKLEPGSFLLFKIHIYVLTCELYCAMYFLCDLKCNQNYCLLDYS